MIMQLELFMFLDVPQIQFKECRSFRLYAGVWSTFM